MGLQDLSHLTDQELIAGYKANADKAFVGELFRRYTHLVFGVCVKYLRDEDEAHDAVMQIVEKLFEDLKKHEIKQFKSWLHTVAKNHCLMHLRSKKSETQKAQELKKDWPVVMESDTESHLNKEVQLDRLEEGIQQLKDEQKICIELFYLKEKCYQEVASITGYDLNQVKSFIQNGKRNLKLILTGMTT